MQSIGHDENDGDDDEKAGGDDENDGDDDENSVTTVSSLRYTTVLQ